MRSLSINERITNHLILTKNENHPLGLCEGKMGIAIFFFEYARYSRNDLFTEIASDFLDNIWSNITTETPLDFNSGLAGIGWGIEYLIHNDFVKGTSGLCEEIDNVIINAIKLFDSAQYSSRGEIIVGFIHYLSARLQNYPHSFHSSLSDCKDILIDILDQVSASGDLHEYPLVEHLISHLKYGSSFEYIFDLHSFIDSPVIINVSEVTKNPLGLKNGLTGYMLSKLKS